MPDDAYAQWSRRHGGLDAHASGWVSGWIRLTSGCAGPLARRGVGADAVTVAGVVVTAAVPVLAAFGAAWPLAAVPVLVVGAVLDGVDGALASITGSASRWGQVVDSLADRLCDLLLVVTLVVLGAPGWLGATLGTLMLLQESVRATAQAAGMTGAGAVTVSERPTRVIVASFAAFLCGLEWCARRMGVDVLADVDGTVIATAAAVIGLGLGLVAFTQLAVAVRRSLV